MFPLCRLRPCPRKLLSIVALSLAASSPVSAQSAWARQTSGTAEFLTAGAHGNGTHVVVGDSGTVLSSPDGYAWSPESSGTTAALRAVIHAGGQFVAAGGNGAVLTSPDGEAWTARMSGTTSFLTGLAYGMGRYVAVGVSGKIVTSPDAIVWSPANSSSGSSFSSVVFAEGKFVAVGSGGTLRISSDGLAWGAATSPTLSYFYGCNHFGDRFYAFGQGGTLVSSADAVDWTTENSGTLSALRSMASDGTSALLCGDGGTLLVSTDGAAWSAVPSGLAGILNGASYANDVFLAVGEPSGAGGGVILAAGRDDGVVWTAPEVSVSEKAGSLTVSIRRIGDVSEAATVDFQTLGGSATPGVDFEAIAGSAAFAVGERLVPVVVPILNHPDAEPLEFFEIELSSPDPAALLVFNPVTVRVSIVDAQDSDFDGLPDEWEILHFGDPSSHGPDDDPDGDRNSNARELADGTDPGNPGSASYRLAVAVDSGSGGLIVTPDLSAYPVGTVVTIAPVGSGDFFFAGWTGDVGGDAAPLVITMEGDTSVGAVFAVTLAGALDEDCLEWTTSGTGNPWQGQGIISFDGADAAQVGGLASGEQSVLESLIFGPAELSFQWKVSTGAFDSYRFFIDGSPRSTLSGVSGWARRSFFVGAGAHVVKWTYAKNSSSLSGSNQAWLDQVETAYGFELWLQAYFNATERQDPLVSGAGADPEEDGIPNLLEYVHNLHPRVGDGTSTSLPTLSTIELEGEYFATMTWSQHAKRAREANLLVAVEYSESLAPGHWHPLEAPVEILSNTGMMQTVRTTSEVPVSAGRRFYRLTAAWSP